ncbi:MAG: NADH-ubiquinone oxidoreductase-F iron-sulfur binding region domain-containing protein [Akkermansiaceae bacterium]|nr:NADH-ubiquinone oxidoreductase-F iron-sulfur binding region domain-containing protein [Akkermansiaceae bacterium]
MADATNEELIEQWKNEPAPLLPLLHAFHDRDGYLSDDALRAVSDGLKTPLADLYGTVTFYHHFSRTPGGLEAPRVCTGNICCMRGGNEILETLKSQGQAATEMPCSGRCDEPVPVLTGHTTLAGTSADNLKPTPSPIPSPYPGENEECLFSNIRKEGHNTLEGYQANGGFSALTKTLSNATPEDVIETITASKLAGRGGAGFPTGIKWNAVAECDRHPKSIVCNADEGEPGCFKDRTLMDYDPYALIEGMIIAGFATGAPRGFIYLRYEYPETNALLERCLAEALEAGLLGNNIQDSGFTFHLYVRRGAGAYICGEEGSLLNSLEGKHPFPRNKPPFPVTHGFEDKPTAVNNVETLCAVPHIINRGAEWYQSLGLGEHPGTKLISLSGDIKRPGNYEVPIGLPLKTLLYDWAGGPLEGRSVQAVTMAGLSGGFLGHQILDDLTLDDPCIRSHGSFLGAGGIMVFDDTRDMVKAAHDAMAFFAHESCGKCFPCRIGTQRLTERLSSEPNNLSHEAWTEEVNDIGEAMKATSACGLGMAAPNVTESLQKYFPDQVEASTNN